MNQVDVDVVVVGAGVAGLVAGRDLARNGYQVVVLEARDRVGGRLLNATLPGGAPIEVGGQWVGPGQTRVLELIAELGLSLYPTHTGPPPRGAQRPDDHLHRPYPRAESWCVGRYRPRLLAPGWSCAHAAGAW